MENNKDYLQHIIDAIRQQGVMKGQDRTIRDIAGIADLSAEQLQSFLNGEIKIPEDLIANLLTSYGLKVVHFRSVEDIPYFPEDGEFKK